ncbi:hypothetical protein [Amphibacillus jilinensis]|uniref:hypothetical protein n=1 Tax=Amphibacillus jilinensis TaxID=1216008 RepID=UPI0002FE85A6|nr:hypothetical protein [Amphibacillus jilinensis]
MLELDLRVIDVNDVLLDLNVVEEFDEEKHIFIEHDKFIYMSHSVASEILCFDVTYDEDNLFAEILKGESDYKHETIHDDKSSATVNVKS